MNVMHVASTPVLRRGAVALVAVCACLSVAVPATAQISGLGPPVGLAPVYSRGVDVAYDPVNNVYLVVGAFDSVIGVFVNENGAALGPYFLIKAPARPASEIPHAQRPAVQWAAHANNGNGGFIVIWPSENSRTDVGLHSRMVAYPTGPYGPEQRISDAFTAYSGRRPAVEYSPISRHFLAVWPTHLEGALKARLVDVNGTGVGSIIPISTTYARDPAITWNSTNDEFGVSYSGEENPACGGPGCRVYSAFARIPASNIGAFGRTTFNAVAGLRTEITDIDYLAHTNQYLMAWYESNANVKSIVINADGSLASAPSLITNQIGSYDALSIAYNPVSRTTLFAGVNRPANNLDDIFAAELGNGGVRTTAEVQVTGGVGPARFPRLVANTRSKTWNAVFGARESAILANQIIQTTSTGPGGTPAPQPQPQPPPPPPPPAPAVPNPQMNTDIPGMNASVSGALTVAGWAVDLGSPTGTGVDVIQVWAYPVGGGSPRFLGTPSYGHGRPDVGGIFGARFTPSGFHLVTAIDTPGLYDVTVFAHSTLTGTFNNVQVRRVRVTAPPTLPRMNIDIPERSQIVAMNFRVAGWALDAGSTSGTGVDAIHVYAYPVAGGSPIFVGVASYGHLRPDVGAAFGSPRYANTGFSLTVTEGMLPRGEYNLVVFARSTISNTFNAMLIRLRVA